ncbi:MAG: HD domain-containing protein [Rhodospirillales bacterium]|nr:HD domain-containing protein [Rhodospirillales bacterium]
MASSPGYAYHRSQICVIDSNDRDLGAVRSALDPYYDVQAFANSQDALDWLRGNRPALVVMDEACRPLSGLSLLEAFFRIPIVRQGEWKSRAPVICTGSGKGSPFLLRARELKADFLMLKPYKGSQLLQAVSALVNRKHEEGWERLPEAASDALLLSADLFDSLSDMVENNLPLPLGSIALACKAIDTAAAKGQTGILLNSLIGHNNVIFVHSLRVAMHLALFGRATGVSGMSLMSLIMAGLLHDMGKIGIPVQTLNKPGELSFEERKLMRGHLEDTTKILDRSAGVPQSVVAAIAQHHERLDGTGYPQGLIGEAVSAFGRQLAIADVYCAMTDLRPYRPAKSRDEALAEMQTMKGAFDPALFKLFKRLVAEESALAVPSEPAIAIADEFPPPPP